MSPINERDFPALFAAQAVVAGVVGEVADELARARRRFPVPMHSPHEGWAVIAEEFEELWEHVRDNTGRGPASRAEAIQLSAMGMRYVIDVCDAPAPDPVTRGLKCDNHDEPDCPLCIRWFREAEATRGS